MQDFDLDDLIFEWDEKKATENYRKHKIRFEKAQLVFKDPFHATEQDRTENGEERWKTLGMVGTTLLLSVAHTVRENGIETIRIISARPASHREKRLYHGNRKIQG